MIFAHNMPSKIEEYDIHRIEKSSSTHFANAMEEFTYVQEKYTTTFRNFIKGSLFINENFNLASSKEITDKIENFIEKISYTNYVNDLVQSSTKTNVTVSNELLNRSHHVNKELIKILNVTHIVCWGKNVFNYFLSQPEIKTIERWKDFEKIDGLKNRNGFEFAQIEFNGKEICLLKVFHPSMPSFGHYNKYTQDILSWFYNL